MASLPKCLAASCVRRNGCSLMAFSPSISSNTTYTSLKRVEWEVAKRTGADLCGVGSCVCVCGARVGVDGCLGGWTACD